MGFVTGASQMQAVQKHSVEKKFPALRKQSKRIALLVTFRYSKLFLFHCDMMLVLEKKKKKNRLNCVPCENYSGKWKQHSVELVIEMFIRASGQVLRNDLLEACLI